MRSTIFNTQKINRKQFVVEWTSDNGASKRIKHSSRQSEMDIFYSCLEFVKNILVILLVETYSIFLLDVAAFEFGKQIFTADLLM